MTEYFSRGEQVALRYLEHGGGIVAAAAWRVVEDGAGRSILYLSAGSSVIYAQWERTNGRIDPARREPIVEKPWRGRDVLRIMYPETPYSIWLLWDMPQHDLVGWYVNLEAPFARTEIGFDTQDHELDVVIRPDFSWRWKDEDDLRDLVDGGIFSDARAAAIRAAGEDAIARLEQREAPFSEPWPEWRPDAGWGPLGLPPRWDEAPEAELPG